MIALDRTRLTDGLADASPVSVRGALRGCPTEGLAHLSDYRADYWRVGGAKTARLSAFAPS